VLDRIKHFGYVAGVTSDELGQIGQRKPWIIHPVKLEHLGDPQALFLPFDLLPFDILLKFNRLENVRRNLIRVLNGDIDPTQQLTGLQPSLASDQLEIASDDRGMDESASANAVRKIVDVFEIAALTLLAFDGDFVDWDSAEFARCH
jgi:hypothetical protein